MPALTEAHYEALRCARRSARVVLAKHRSVTLGGVWGRGVEAVSITLRLDGDQRRIGHEGEDLGGSQDPARAGSPK